MSQLKNLIKSRLGAYFDNSIERGQFVREELQKIPQGSSILDAGAGSQRYRKDCSHLKYFAQDFGQVTVDAQKGFASLTQDYEYGRMDYTCDIVSIPVEDGKFDAVLCTEVFEHLPDPVKALAELARILKPGGSLILTVPSNCLRHFDPYFFYTGFSDRWLDHWLREMGFDIVRFCTEGNYFKWLALELARAGRQNPLALPFLLPAFVWFYVKGRKADKEAVSTLCGGYYVVARKRNANKEPSSV
ncbi:MAG: class I SAM-dependent methyltransferase [Bdellovibrionales bacterium]